MHRTLSVLLFAGVLAAQSAETVLLPDLLDLRDSSARVQARIGELQNEAALQTVLGNPVTAATITGIVTNLQSWQSGAAALPVGTGIELHAVGFYEGSGATSTTPGTASVEVDRPGSVVALLLNAYEPITWTITETPGTVVVAVISYSYEAQTLLTAGVPNAAVLQLSYAANGDGTFFGVPESDLESRLQTNAWSLGTLGQFVTTWTGDYTAPATTFVAGPGNQVWRDQWVTNEALREGNTWNVATRAQVQASVGGVLFLPLLTGPLFSFSPPTVAIANALGVVAPIVTLPGVTDYVFGTTSIFTLAGGDPSILDPATLASTPIPPDPLLPAFSWINTIAYDSVRDRLLVSGFGGGGTLYAWDVATSTWSVLIASWQNQEPAAMCYHPTYDATFGLLVDPYASTPFQLRQYDQFGTVTASHTLPLPVFADLLDNHQLYVYGAALVYVGPAREVLGFQVRHCYVINPLTGDVLSASFYFN